MPFIVSRKGLLNWAFSQFTCLQIAKSIKSFPTNPFLLVLIGSAFFILFMDPENRFASLCMYLSFLSLSILEGSLSNHVVVSCAIALLVLFTPETNLRKAFTSFTAVLYLSTGVHKLNHDFFDPTHSCASLYLSGAISVLPQHMLELEEFLAITRLLLRLAPFAAVTFELGMPVLLVFHYSDKWLCRFIAIGSIFHAILALPPSPLSVYPFSAIMIPIYLVLLPESSKIEQTVSRLLSRYLFKASMIPIFLLAHFYAPSLLFSEHSLFEYPDYGLWSVFLVWNCAWWSAIIRSCFTVKEVAPKPFQHSPLTWPPLLIIFSLFLFALTPYLGLRNYPALAMFSNLKVEGSNPNHWIPSYDSFGYLSDWVEITRANTSFIKSIQVDLGQMFPSKLKTLNHRLGIRNELYITPPIWILRSESDPAFTPFSTPLVELRRVLSSHILARIEPVSFDYVRHDKNGSIIKKTFHSEREKNEDEVQRPLTLFERMFVRFRTFSDISSVCRH